MDRLLNRMQTLLVLGVSDWSLRALVDAGQLTPVFVTPARGKQFFRESDVQRLVAEGPAAAATLPATAA
jgi:hypothetical protein